MPDSYTKALFDLKRLQLAFARGQVFRQPGTEEGALVGFALHSETLQPLAVLEARDLQLHAHDAITLRPGESFRADALHFMSRRRLTVVRHAKGGLYTRLGVATLGEDPLVLYASHHDHVWWLRPLEMFEDGRFAELPEATPLTSAVIRGLA